MRRFGFSATLCLLLASSSLCFGAEISKNSNGWVSVTVRSAIIADKAQAYVGDGDDISAPSAFGGGGMSMIIMVTGDDKKTHSYLAGAVNSQGGKVLSVSCEFKNVSATPQTFHPLDVELGDKAGALAAVGSGGFPFAKDAATWDRLRKKLTWTVQQGDSRILNYVFAVPSPASTFTLNYQGAKLAEIHPTSR